MSQAFDYAKSAVTALRLILKFGRVITMTRTTPGSGPSHNPGPSVPQSTSVTAVVLPAKKGTIDAFDDQFEGGTLIEEKLRLVYIAAKDIEFAPTSGMTLTFDGAVWTILGCTPLSPAGVVVFYRVGCKRN